jgi:hypothetical protein
MFLSNNFGLFESPYVCIGKDCKELNYAVLWANEENKTMCVYEIKNNYIIRNEYGIPKTKILRNIDFKIVPREDFVEMNILETEKLEEGV